MNKKVKDNKNIFRINKLFLYIIQTHFTYFNFLI